MKSEIREPRQKRAIEKKNKIISSGYKLFSEVGYHSTTTADIAKDAGVSTGIVYGYFRDKRDILLDILDIYIDDTFRPIFEIFDEATVADAKKLMTDIVEGAVRTHQQNAKMHEVLHSLQSTDEAVNKKFLALEDDITLKLAEKLKAAGVEIENPLEKIHVGMNVVQSFAHEYVFDHHRYLNYDVMKTVVIDFLVNLIQNNKKAEQL